MNFKKYLQFMGIGSAALLIASLFMPSTFVAGVAVGGFMATWITLDHIKNGVVKNEE